MTQTPANTLRILVVEDDPLVREVVCAQLIESMHEPVGLDNGFEALEKFKAGSFNLVITDQSMPGMSGDELAAAIKQINPGMPVILLTGYGDGLADDEANAVDLVVCKPFSIKLLRESIAKVMENKSSI